jgi:hypothetical protein
VSVSRWISLLALVGCAVAAIATLVRRRGRSR